MSYVSSTHEVYLFTCWYLITSYNSCLINIDVTSNFSVISNFHKFNIHLNEICITIPTIIIVLHTTYLSKQIYLYKYFRTISLIPLQTIMFTLYYYSLNPALNRYTILICIAFILIYTYTLLMLFVCIFFYINNTPCIFTKVNTCLNKYRIIIYTVTITSLLHILIIINVRILHTCKLTHFILCRVFWGDVCLGIMTNLFHPP